MASRIVEADIDKVLDNPNRDFTNYPIDQAQVDRLVASFEDTGGIWHAIPARPGKERGTYELAFGHHRKEAAKALGYKKMRLEADDHDDDQMILMLAVENGTQRVNNAAASLDSVAAITRRLAYLILRAQSLDHLVTIVTRSEAERLFESQKAFETARGNLLNGKGVGNRLILRYAPKGSLDEREVNSSIGALKQTGGYQRLIEHVTNQVQAELAAEQAAREAEEAKEREWQELKAKQERELQEKEERKAAEQKQREEEAQAKAEQKRLEAEERRKEAEAKREQAAADKAKRDAEKAELEAQKAADKLAKLEAEREDREAKAAQAKKDREEREAAKKAEQDAARAEQARKEAEAIALAVKAAESDPLVDSAVVQYFRNHHALSRFREIVTDGNNRHWFPVSEQLGHVKEICRTFEEQNRKSAAENLTANYVASYLNGYLRECLRGKREDEKRQRSLDESFDVAMTKAAKGASWITGAVVDMIKLLKDGASVPHDFEAQLRGLEERTCDELARLRAASGYAKGGEEIAGRVAASPARLAIPSH